MSSQKSLLQGLALAVALHIALLAIQGSFFGFGNDRLPKLSVSIQLQTINIDKEPANTLEPDPQRQIVEQPETLDFPEKIILAKASDDDSGRERKPAIQLSASSDNFRRFLQSETDRNIDSKQNKLSEFSANFEPYFDAPETAPETSYRDFQGALGGGQYKVTKNGRVTCVLKMVPLSFDDHIYGAGGGTKDCTPKKKFDLNLRKNTREQ